MVLRPMIIGMSSACLALAGLPRLGGPASPWRACLTVEQRKLA